MSGRPIDIEHQGSIITLAFKPSFSLFQYNDPKIVHTIIIDTMKMIKKLSLHFVMFQKLNKYIAPVFPDQSAKIILCEIIKVLYYLSRKFWPILYCMGTI